MDEPPEMSVVVPVRLAPATITATITELLNRQGLEVMAVVSTDDPTRLLLREIKQRRPHLEVVEVLGMLSAPQLRAHGIRRARGRLIAVTEDHCRFSESWPAALAPALDDPAVGACGGVVVNGLPESLLGWAVFFSRYAPMMPPLTRGPAAELAGSNVCYRRELLEQLVLSYQDGFWEHEVHQEIVRRGQKLWMEPDARVSHGKAYSFWRYCTLRFRHGRCFAGRKRGKLSFLATQWRILRSPLVPAVLLLRCGLAVFAKRRLRGKYLLALPLLAAFYGMWALGELTGYAVGPGYSCSRTD